MSTPASGPLVTFWGAAQTVTGSMHLVEAAGRKLLLDCGSYRGSRDEARSRNRHFPFKAKEIAAVVLSHAHADHCGNLPELVRQGFTGPIFCTPPTRDIVEVMLADSAKFREEDERVARIMRARGRRVVDDDDDDELDEGDGLSVVNVPCPHELAHQAAMQCLPVTYDRELEILPGITLRFAIAGHILGSAQVKLTFDGGKSLAFTGDIGRRGVPYLWPAAPVPEADVLICESTYGGRVHPSLEQMAESMAVVVRRVAAEGGRVLVPAFSLGRTQLVVHYLNRWMADGLMPRLPIYVDGPLAASISDIYRDHASDLVDPTAYPLKGIGKEVKHVTLLEQSRELTQSRYPCVIVASSGMCDGGRILQHLKQHIDDPRSAVVLVSYQAPATLGAKLLEPRPSVRIHGRDWPLWAEVHKLDGFSGHAGHDDMLSYLRPHVGRLKKIRLVHGEPAAAEALAEGLRDIGFDDVAVPASGDTMSP